MNNTQDEGEGLKGRINKLDPECHLTRGVYERKSLSCIMPKAENIAPLSLCIKLCIYVYICMYSKEEKGI